MGNEPMDADTFDEVIASVRQAGRILRGERMPRVAVAFGTRPERIKLEPVTRELQAHGLDVVEWCSGQSRDLVASNGAGMRAELWQGGVTQGIAHVLCEFRDWLEREKPHAVVVQGDTATAYACAQAAFLAEVPVAHVEAGLRTYASEPYPEEAFRRQIGAVARWHFAPDEYSAGNLLFEGVEHSCIHVVGNTVIDTLPAKPFRVLATLHRRENWGVRIIDALGVLNGFKESNERVKVRVIRHPNWRAWDTEGQCEMTSLEYIPPVGRDDLLAMVQRADLVVTDSGGLQEEAAHFGTPCLVLRTSTERVALERAGAVELVHPDEPEQFRYSLEGELAKRRCYGSGDASRKIAEVLAKELLACA